MNQGYGVGGRAGIRHAYPLSVTNPSFTSAFVLNLRTLPYAFVRFFLHATHAVVAVAFFGAAFVCAGVVGKTVHPFAGVAVLFIGVAIYGILWTWWFRYVLYAVKCGHIACLTDLVTRGKVGNGNEGMLSYGKHVVRERFPDVVQLFLLQGLIRGVVSEFNAAIGFLGDFLPFNIGVMFVFGRRLLRTGTRYLDESLFSYSLIRRSEPLWDACSEGLGYYFQNSKEILKTSIWMMVINSALRTLLSLVIAIGAMWFLFLTMKGVASDRAVEILNVVTPATGLTGDAALDVFAIGSALLGTLIFTMTSLYAVEHAFLHPIYLTMVMTKFLMVIQSQPLDPSFERYLGSSRAQKLRNFATQLRAR